MLTSPTAPATGAGPSAASGPHDDDVPAAYSSGYSSFPSAAQSPPTTASTMRPSLSGLATASTSSFAAAAAAAASVSASVPRQHFPFSHDDTDKSRLAYETLSVSAKAYRVALGQLSLAASNFGSALEACARLKEARAQPYPPGPYTHIGGLNNSIGGGSSIAGGGGGIGLMSSGGSLHEASCTADVLLATSGLYYLMANQQGILAETVYRSFELPIVHELDRYGADVEDEQESYAAGMREASREIRRLEKEGVKLRKPRQRDVGRMRSHLVAMTAALDSLTTRQGEHAVALLDQSRDMSGTVSQASRNLVRAEVDILDNLARKGWPGGGLDVVLDGAVDLFSRDGYDDDGDGDGGNYNINRNNNGGVGVGVGISNGAGIGSSSHAVVSGAGGILGSGVGGLGRGSKLLPLGGSSGGPMSSPSIDDDGFPDIDDGDADDDGDDDGGDESEVSTIDGNAKSNNNSRAAAIKEPVPSSTTGGGGFFSILTGGNILGRKTDVHSSAAATEQSQTESVSGRRGRSSTKEQRQRSSTRSQQSLQEEARAEDAPANDDAEGNEDSTQPPIEEPQHRYARTDSLSVDSANQQQQQQHQYQSLDSLAYPEATTSAAGSDTAPTHTRGVSASRKKTQKSGSNTVSSAVGGGHGRSRPFSPQRVSVDPQEDLFTGQFSSPERTMSLAWLKEGEQLEAAAQDGKEMVRKKDNGDEDEGPDAAEDGSQASGGSGSGSGKGKGKVGAKSITVETTSTSAEPPSPTAVPTSTSISGPASRASSATPTPDMQHEEGETDEGVHIWRQEG